MAAVCERNVLVFVIMSAVFALLFVNYLFDDFKNHGQFLPKISGSSFTEKDMSNTGRIFPNKYSELTGDV